MKQPKLKMKKKVRIRGVRKLRQDVREIVNDCLLDIQWYIVDDVIRYLKKRGVLYYEKSKKKNKKKSKR